MDIRVLKYFVTVVEEENILKASQVLHITQPTLSRQLMDLEKELNLKALNNSKSNKNPTDILFIEYLFYWLKIIRHTVENSKEQINERHRYKSRSY